MFKPGQSGNPAGRPVGIKDRRTLAVKEAFQAAFDDLQADENVSLPKWARENPTDFYKLASKLIPAELNAHLTGNLTALLGRLGKAGGGKDDSPVA